MAGNDSAAVKLSAGDAEAASSLDKIAAREQSASSTAGDASAAAGAPIEGSLLSSEDATRQQARAVVGVLRGIVDCIDERVEWPENVYAEAEERLAPVLQKYAVADSVAGRYVGEIAAGLFLGGLAFATVRQVAALRQRDAAAARAGGKEGRESPVGPASNGEQAQPGSLPRDIMQG